MFTRLLSTRAAIVSSAAVILASCLLGPAWSQQRLTDSRAPLERPAISADGQRVAYVRRTPEGDSVSVSGISPDALSMVLMDSGPVDSDIIGRPMWTNEGRRVAWVTADGSLWQMDDSGRTVVIPVAKPRSPVGAMYWPHRNAVIIYSRAMVYAYVLDEELPGTQLPMGHINSRISSLGPGPTEESLLYIDSGEVRVWSDGPDGRVLLSPDRSIAEFTAASAHPGSECILAVARTRGSAEPSTILRLSLVSGRVDRVQIPGRSVQEILCVRDDVAVAEAGDQLWLINWTEEWTGPLFGAGVRDFSPALGPGRRWLAFASVGRDDTDLDGAITPEDPSAIYWSAVGDYIHSMTSSALVSSAPGGQ